MVIAVADSTYVLLLGVVILCVVMYRMSTRPRGAARSHSDTDRRAELARAREAQGMKSDIEELMLQLQELAREIGAQIDTRFAKLEASIRSADERIRTLQRLQAEESPAAQDRPTVDVVVGDDDPAAGTADSPPPREAGVRQKDQPPAEPTLRDLAPTAAERQMIFAMADAGKDAVQIAQETGQSPGEIELILSLRASSKPRSA